MFKNQNPENKTQIVKAGLNNERVHIGRNEVSERGSVHEWTKSYTAQVGTRLSKLTAMKTCKNNVCEKGNSGSYVWYNCQGTVGPWLFKFMVFMVHVSCLTIQNANREPWTVHDSRFEKKTYYQRHFFFVTPSWVPLPLTPRTTTGATPVLSQIASHILLHSPFGPPTPNPKDNHWGNSGPVANRIAYTATFTIIGLGHFNFAIP